MLKPGLREIPVVNGCYQRLGQGVDHFKGINQASGIEGIDETSRVRQQTVAMTGDSSGRELQSASLNPRPDGLRAFKLPGNAGQALQKTLKLFFAALTVYRIATWVDGQPDTYEGIGRVRRIIERDNP